MNDYLPLTEATFFILLSLVNSPKHGYAIMQDAEALSDGRVTLSTGTLYGALKRLLDREWIARTDESQPSDGGKPRKDYYLTDLGRRILSAETNRLERLAQAAQRRLQGGTL